MHVIWSLCQSCLFRKSDNIKTSKYYFVKGLNEFQIHGNVQNCIFYTNIWTHGTTNLISGRDVALHICFLEINNLMHVFLKNVPLCQHCLHMFIAANFLKKNRCYPLSPDTIFAIPTSAKVNVSFLFIEAIQYSDKRF